MEWRQIEDFPDYEISEDGRVRRATRANAKYCVGFELKAKPHARGYLRYDLVNADGQSKGMLAHRLVALAFLGEPPTPDHQVAHNDGTRTNNHRANLRWATPLENQADRKKHGTFHAGEQCGSAKLSKDCVHQIRKQYAEGGKKYSGGSVTYRDLAAQYGVSQAQISRVVNGSQWT